MKEQFFFLLSSGLGFRNDKPTGFPLTEKQWMNIWNIALKQTVCGLIFAGIEKLDYEIQPPKKLLMQFLAYSEQIKKSNLKIRSVEEEILGWFNSEGLEPVVIKGQSVSVLYPVQNLRMPGDIDIFFHKDYDKVVPIVIKKGIDVTLDSNHDKFTYKDIPVELHHTAFKTIYPIDNIDFSPTSSYNEKYKGKMLRIKANALLLLIHPAKHFMNEGIGLRHLCDWALFLKKYEEYPEVSEAWEEVKRQGAERFAIEFTALAVKYLGVNLNNSDKWIGKSNPKLMEKMLQIIIKRGNFAIEIKKIRSKECIKYFLYLAKHILDTYPYWESFFWIYTPKRLYSRALNILRGNPLKTN